jgi:hypothetical protein
MVISGGCTAKCLQARPVGYGINGAQLIPEVFLVTNHTVPYGTALRGGAGPRHFVPGYDHAVPPGQNTFSPPPSVCLSILGKESDVCSFYLSDTRFTGVVNFCQRILTALLWNRESTVLCKLDRLGMSQKPEVARRSAARGQPLTYDFTVMTKHGVKTSSD